MFEFRHPHIETRINDNSFVNENLLAGTGSSILFQPYFSDKGEDNVIKKYGNLTDFLNKNGKPVFKKHGQAIYNATAWLKKAPIYGLRLMPTDATYSNLVLSVSVTPKTEDLGDSIELKTTATTVAELTDGKQFLTGIKTLPAEPSGQVFNFLGFKIKGRGSYGNDYAIKIKLNNPKSKATEYRCYDISVLSTNESGIVNVVEGPFSVSFSPDAINLSGESLFVKNVMDSYSENIQCVFDEEAYEALITKLSTSVEDFNAKKFDIFFGKDEEMKDYTDVKVAEDTAKLDQLSGVALQSGTNGELDTCSSQAERLSVMNKLYKAVYEGTLVPEILNKRAYPFDVVLDANHPIDVKNEMITLCQRRSDAFPFLDCGISASYSANAAVNFRKTEFDNDTYVGAIFAPSRIIRDPYGNGNIEVTFTYSLASKIPEHDATLGCQYPLAGPNYGKVGRLVENELSFNPDDYQQEDLYINQVNYVTQDVTNEGEIGSQLTLQKKLSALSDINNVRALFKIVRQIENVAVRYKHEFSDDITLAAFQGELNAIAPIWINNRACSTLDLTAYQTDYDKAMKKAQVKVNIVFNSTMETIEINVNVGRL